MQQVKKRVVDLSIHLQSNGQNESRLIEHAVTHQSMQGRSSSSKSIVNSNRDRRTTTVLYSFLFFSLMHIKQTKVNNRFIIIIIDFDCVI